jgi:hypothetical protein
LIRRLITLLIAVAAMATAAGVVVVSASFALYALVRTYIGPAGAAAVVCASAAVLILLIALVAFRRSRKPAPKAASLTGKSALADRLADVLRERPVAAAGAAAAAGLLAWRNPQLATILLRLFDPASARGRRP